MSPVHKNGKLNRSRPADIHESVERSANGPAREQDIVDKNNIFARDIIEYIRCVQSRLRQFPAEVISVKSDIKRSDRRGDFFHLKHGRSDPAGKVFPPRPDADDAERSGTMIPFNDFM